MGSSTQRTGWGTKQGSDQEVLCRLVWDFSLDGQQQGVQRNLPDPFQPGSHPHPLERKFAQSCPTLCDPMNSSPPGSSVHGILQARILEQVVMPFSREPSQPRDRTCVSCIAGRFFTTESPEKPKIKIILFNSQDSYKRSNGFTYKKELMGGIQ